MKRPKFIDVPITEETVEARRFWREWRTRRGNSILNSDDPTKGHVLPGTTLPSGRVAVRMTKVEKQKRFRIRRQQRDRSY